LVNTPVDDSVNFGGC